LDDHRPSFCDYYTSPAFAVDRDCGLTLKAALSRSSLLVSLFMSFAIVPYSTSKLI
jgi:hypothetical protein